MKKHILYIPEGQDISIEMTAPPEEKAYIRDRVTYNINVKNICETTLNKVTVSLIVPKETVYIELGKNGEFVHIEEKRQKQDGKDKEDYEIILKAYKYRNRKKGARQIKMLFINNKRLRNKRNISILFK